MQNKNKYIWLEYLLYSVTGFTLPIWARLLELPKWNNPHWIVNGERLMATHDAYYFLAGAIGTARNIDQPLSIIVNFLSHFTHIPLATVGFFFPVITCSLIIFPLFFLTKKYQFPEASITACLLGSCCMGYFGRTRLGFLDTDTLVMFFNITFLAAIAIWLENIMSQKTEFSEKFILKAAIVGTWGAIFKWFYGAGTPIIWGALIIGYFTLLIDNFLKKKNKENLLLFSIGFCLIIAIIFFPILGLLCAGISLAFLRFISLEDKKIYAFIFGVFLVVFIVQKLYYLPYNILQYALSLAKIKTYVVEQNQTTTLALPDVNQSIRELQNIPMKLTISRMAFTNSIFVVGLIGFIYAVYKRMSLGIFVILLLLGFSSVKFGNRFTMYGGVPLGLGLGLGFAFFLQDIFKEKFNKTFKIGIQIVMGCLLLFYIFPTASKYFPSPVLPPIYAKTFIQTGKISPPNARLWQWWDYGYAAQYYAKRTTFGDGGAHDGPFLYPAALVHISDSPLQASNLIKFITQKQWEEYTANKTVYDQKLKDAPPMWRYALIDPMKPFCNMGSKKARDFIYGLKHRTVAFSKDLPPQYVVFSWENLNIAYWISYFGTWDFVLKTGFPGKIQQLKGKLGINIENGELTINNKKIQLSQLLVVSKKGSKRFEWSNNVGLYGVYNKLSNQFYIMDGTIYFSNMIQMLLGDAKKIYPGFQLVIDNFPWNRVYRVR